MTLLKGIKYNYSPGMSVQSFLETVQFTDPTCTIYWSAKITNDRSK